jgi:hypothetical protein
MIHKSSPCFYYKTRLFHKAKTIPLLALIQSSGFQSGGNPAAPPATLIGMANPIPTKKF